jgi:hypothetical protein
MTRAGLILALVILGAIRLEAATYFVASTGLDTNSGTIDFPFKTIARGVTAAVAGDTIYVRGGTHVYNTTISISKQGTDSTWFHLWAYPGERPFLDFSSMPTSGSLRGFNISGSYWHILGFDIFRAGDNGMLLRGHHNKIEYCSFSENRDTGLQLASGAANNQVINCDSYFNEDITQGNADGFASKLDVGTGNYFYGCRAWQNSDDGYDGYLRGANNVFTTLENCWIFRNGYLKSGSPSTGNGNGFKLGGSDSANLQHDVLLKNCLAFDNRVKGFDQNNDRGSMTLLNCTGYRNGTNYSISLTLAVGESLTVKNCAALGSYGSIGAFAIQQTNSWMAPSRLRSRIFSTDTAGVRGPRQADGSLPDLGFMHLAQGSDLIDGGTDVGLPYIGAGPDLGYAESDWPLAVDDPSALPGAFELYQNYPNPFNPVTVIRYSVGVGQSFLTVYPVSLKIYDMLGQLVATLVDESKSPGNTAYSGTRRMSQAACMFTVFRPEASAMRKIILVK